MRWNGRPTTKDLGRRLLYKRGISKNKTRDITAEGYLIYISEIVNGSNGGGVLIIVNNYFFGLTWGNDSKYQFDSHTNDENGNLLISGMAGLLQFDVVLTGILHKISLLQYFPSDFALSSEIYKR